MLGKGSRPEANPRITRGGKRHKRIHGDGNSFGRNSYALNLPSPRVPLCVGGRSSVERVALASRSAPELSKENSTSRGVAHPAQGCQRGGGSSPKRPGTSIPQVPEISGDPQPGWGCTSRAPALTWKHSTMVLDAGGKAGCVRGWYAQVVASLFPFRWRAGSNAPGGNCICWCRTLPP